MPPIERIRSVVRFRPLSSQDAWEPRCIKIVRDELVVQPSAAVGARDRSPTSALAGNRHAPTGGGELPSTPVSARARVPATPLGAGNGHAPTGGGAPPSTPVSARTHVPATPPPRGVGSRFKCDEIFAESATQEKVYQVCSELVDAPLNGENACILMYGQTGSGKTHTMIGTGDDPGIIRRACDQIFAQIAERQLAQPASATQEETRVSASFIELYNDTFKDLVGSDNP
jgi:hypothetical protein